MSEIDIEQRISAGAIIIENGQILLVRDIGRNGKSFLVAPGGGALDGENVKQTAIREVKEETGLDVNPYKILFVEDLISSWIRGLKIWFLSRLTGGQLERTEGAIEDGIIEARWYRREELKGEIVYPQLLLDTDWELFFENTWETRHLVQNTADADF